MITVKGFYSAPKFNSNVNNVTAVFGELTQYASTFSRDYKTFAKGLSQINFCLFSCKEADTKVDMNLELTDVACEIGDWMYQIGNNISNSNNKADVISMLTSAFGLRIANVNVGDLVSDTHRRMPKWVSWESSAGANVYHFKIWLSSLDFETNYDEFEIFVVPPVDFIDKLFQPYPDLLVELSRNNISVIHDRMVEIRNKFPETIVGTEMVELIDRTNTNNRTQIGWTTLVYGPAGDTTDRKKDAIIKYIANHSTNAENEWRLLMPDLFNNTCFYIVPRWDRFAITPRLAMPGIHSPVVNAMENYNYVKGITSSFVSAAHLEANLETTIHRYKDLSINVVGSQHNRLGLFKFTDYFADYLAQESMNEDFNRMAQDTKEITNLLTYLFMKIDNFQNDPSLPGAIRFIEKYNKRFLVGKFRNIEYFVLMKPNQQP